MVAEQRQAGLLRHPAGGVEHLLQQGSEAAAAHTGLEYAGFAAGAGDAVGAVAHQQVVDLLLVPEVQPGLLLVVEAGGGDEVQAGAAGHLPDQADIPAQVDGGAVHHGAHAQGFGLAELSRGDLGHLVKLKEAGAEIHAHGPVGAGDVLMHQGLAQFSGVDGAQNALDHHRDSSCLLLLPLL